MNVLLIDDGKLPNLAVMKLSALYKGRGDTVQVRHIRQVRQKDLAPYERIYCSVIFERNRERVEMLQRARPDIAVGGTGWDLQTVLPADVESLRPDYDLYTTADIFLRNSHWTGKRENRLAKAAEIVNAGIGFSSRGCVRACEFCVVPKKEGMLRQETPIRDIINPRSSLITLLDNNFTADPLALEKLREIKERKLTLNITQGIDVRLMTPKLASALASVPHWSSIHYAWDFTAQETAVFSGINLLLQFVRRYKHMCYILVGFNSCFEEDMYRFRKLAEAKISPLVMLYNETRDLRLRHFARWVNGRFYKTVSWDSYLPWMRDRVQLEAI